MSSGFQEDDHVQETMKRVELNRRKAFRYNLLLILFLLVIMVGLFGAVWFFNELESKKAQLNEANQKLEKANTELENIRNKLAKEKTNRDSIISLIYRPSDTVRIKGIGKIITGINNSRQQAEEYARAGYDKLKQYDFPAALDYFNKSEKAYNGYRDSYEVYYLLWQNKNQLDDPVVQDKVMTQIITKYNSLKRLSMADIRSNRTTR